MSAPFAERAFDAATQYAERLGWTDVEPAGAYPDSKNEVDFYGTDGRTVVGVILRAGEHPSPPDPVRIANAVSHMEWIYDTNNAIAEGVHDPKLFDSYRVDTIELLVVGGQKAVLRHTRGANDPNL